MRPHISPGRRLPPALYQIFARPARAKEIFLVAERRGRCTAESDEAIGAQAALLPSGRADGTRIARAAGFFEERRPAHLGGGGGASPARAATARRRANIRDVGVQGAAGRGQRTSRAARRAKDRPAERPGVAQDEQ